MPGTVRVPRVLKAPPERVYRAFLDAAALAKWLPPHGFTCTVHQFDPKAGGTFNMSFTSHTNQQSDSSHGKYLELVPNQKIVHDDQFDYPNLPGVLHVTITFKQVLCGTELNIVQEGIPDVIPVEMCYLG